MQENINANQKRSQRGANLSQADRERGGRTSASRQTRDARGQFAGAVGRGSKSAKAHSSQPINRMGDQSNDESNQLVSSTTGERHLDRRGASSAGANRGNQERGNGSDEDLDH